MSATKNKKNRRRSSLAASKISIGATYSARNDLHKEIGDTLPPQMKLEELSKLAIKHGLEKCVEEINSQEVRDYIQNALPELLLVVGTNKFQEAIQDACNIDTDSASSTQSSDAGSEEQQMIKERTELLKQEETEWKAYIDEMSTLAEQTNKQCEEPSVLYAGDLTPQQVMLSQDYLPKLADLEAVQLKVQHAKQQVFIQGCEHERNVNRTALQQKQLHQMTDEAMENIHEQEFGETRIGSPKSTIEELLTYPTSPDSTTNLAN